MSKMKLAVMIVSAFALVTLCTFFYLAWIEQDMYPPKLPTSSIENTLLLTSNGCCFAVENIEFFLQKEGGQQTMLSRNDTLWGYDIVRYSLPEGLEGPASLVITFHVFYGEEVPFSSSVMEFENMSELKELGVLLYFQEKDDMYFNVVAGERKITYKMGSIEERWSIMEEPNELYE